MDSMFKIECNGAFRAGRSLALLSSMLTHNIQNVDLSLVTTDGVTIPANRGLLALHSKYLAQVTQLKLNTKQTILTIKQIPNVILLILSSLESLYYN